MSKWKDVVAREKAKMRDMTFWKKVEYLAGNWWLEAFGVCLAIAVITFATIGIINANKTRILYFVVTDVEIAQEQSDENCRAFKAYLGDTRWDHLVMADTNVSSLGASDDASEPAFDYQQKSMILIGSGLVDAYICSKPYAEYLRSYDEILPLSEVLTDEQLSRYADRIDGDVMELTGTSAAAAWNANYEPVYLVVSGSMHFPEVVQSFVDFCMQ